MSGVRPGLGAIAIACLALACAACNACGKGAGGAPNVATSDAAPVNRTSVSPDAGPAAVRDVAIWTSAREGSVEDLASLATYEGAAGLVEAATEEELRPTALRAMGYAAGWAQLPYLAQIAAGSNDDDARLALDSAIALAARPRRSVDVEDTDELRDGCEKLGVLARETSRARERRVGAIRALRMMPCPKQEIPVDLDAR